MNREFIDALEALEKEKGISMEVLLDALDAALVSAYKRNFGSLQNVRVDINRASGDIKVLARKTIVEEVEDPRAEVSLEEARAINPNYELGEIVENEVTPRDFGRIAAQTAKQVVVQRIREAERGIIFEEFSNREGDIVTGIVQRYDQKNVYIDLGKTEAVLSPAEQINGEEYRQSERIKTYIVEVKKTTKGPQILVSRTHPGLLKRLFELEVPEIHDGTVELKAVAREAGSRSKIAVYSKDENVDPVGACVGPKGARVQTIVSELKGEKIDIVKWSPETPKFIANALSPAKVVSVDVYEDPKVARVVVPDYQLSLAIGKEGQNARLSAKLTGWKIDIKSESQAAAQAEEERARQAEYDEYYGEGYAEGYGEGYAEGEGEWQPYTAEGEWEGQEWYQPAEGEEGSPAEGEAQYYPEGEGYEYGEYDSGQYPEGYEEGYEGEYGEYPAEGEYVEGEYAQGEYPQGEYAEGEYPAEGEYAGYYEGEGEYLPGAEGYEGQPGGGEANEEGVVAENEEPQIAPVTEEEDKKAKKVKKAKKAKKTTKKVKEIIDLEVFEDLEELEELVNEDVVQRGAKGKKAVKKKTT